MNNERLFTKAEIEYLAIPETGELKNKLYESIVKARVLQKRIDALEGAIGVWANVIVHGQDIAGITEMDAEKALLKCIEL